MFNAASQYFLELGRLHGRLALYPLKALRRSSSSRISLTAQNYIQRIQGRSTRFSVSDEEGLFRADDGMRSVFFSSRVRGYWLYSGGISRRYHRLLSSYCLQHVRFLPDDIVIDCGANYGDLLGGLVSVGISPDRYIAFEPGVEEFRALKRNAPNSCIENLALGDRTGQVDFYISDDSADSSVIEPQFYTTKEKTELVTLDDYVKRKDIRHIKLFKVEAEGFEPEVLYGSEMSLGITSFVAFDGGPERGTKSETTFSEVCNILYKRGFFMIDVNHSWHRALFGRRSAFSSLDKASNSPGMLP